MKTAIIVHGMPSKANFLQDKDWYQNQHWLPWLAASLNLAGIKAERPQMPKPYEPDYEAWRAVFERYPIDENTTLVGHSCGGGFLVRWLSEHKVRVGKVVLVAPWIDPNHKFAPKMFNDFVIDENLVERTAGITAFISLDDDQEEITTLKILKEKIPGMQVREFTDKGHFTHEDMNTNEFPELLEHIVSASW